MPQEGLLKIDETGGLVCVGTENDRILFTSAAKVPKAWIGILIDGANPTNEIGYTDFEYSGLPDGSNKKTNIHLWFDALLNIHHTNFKHITNCAINYALFSDQSANPNLTMDLETIEVSENGCKHTEWD